VGESLAETSEHREVSVQRDAIRTANTKPRKTMLVLQPSKFTLNGSTTTVEGFEPVTPTHDPREQPAAHGDPKHRGFALKQVASAPSAAPKLGSLQMLSLVRVEAGTHLPIC
jgi:hypothetical protein